MAEDIFTGAIADLAEATQIWTWRGFPIGYHARGDAGPAVVLVHGFGASWGHWRKNIPTLATQCRTYAIDLLGFGRSAKPAPNGDVTYTFETWGAQIADFCQEVVGTPAFLVGNSIGCIAAMQAAVFAPERSLGTVALNCSIRQLHERRRSQLPWYRNAGASFVQKLLGDRRIARFLFDRIARPEAVRRVLQQAYARSDAVTDELVAMLLAPARDEGALDVFRAFTRYSQGPLPEDLLAVLPCPALVLWGEEDPWEPLAEGQKLAEFPAVDRFVPLPGVGHCPQDEAPELVNPILLAWILEKAAQNF